MNAININPFNKKKSLDEESLLSINVENSSNPFINKESNIIKNKNVSKLKMKTNTTKIEFNPKSIDLGKTLFNYIYNQT